MKKLWFGLFAFVLSLCCGFALLHGSYTRASLIAMHADAFYMPDVNLNDDSPYWEQVTIIGSTTNVNASGIPYDGKVYFFNSYDENESVLTFDVFDSSTMTITSVDFTCEVTDFGNVYDFSATYNFSLVAFMGTDDYAYYSIDIVNSYVDYSDAEDGYFYISSGENSFVIHWNDVLYNNVALNITDSPSFNDLWEGSFFASRDYLYILGDVSGDLYWYRFSFADGSYIVLDWDYSDWSGSWSDGYNVYYDYGSSHYILDVATNTWVAHTWTGYTGSFNSSNIWSDGNNVYMTTNGTTYMLHITHEYVSPYPNVLAELIALLTSGITGIATGIGANLSVLAESVMIDANTGNLSAFGSLVVIMAGLALALHLCRWMVNFVSSLGTRDR